MTRRKLAVFAAGVGAPSSTRMLADRLADATVSILKDEYDVDVELRIFELLDTAKDATNNLVTGFPSPKLAEHERLYCPAA